jgi:hypothetical protein
MLNRLGSLLLLGLAALARGQGLYKEADPIELYANKVGPFANPNEVYSFYSLPFCAPEDMEIRREDLGPLLKGDRPRKTLYDIHFRVPQTLKQLCKAKLSEADVKKFRQAIVDDYYFELMLDELPIWGYVGELETRAVLDTANATRYYLFTHLDFSIAYNADRVIEARTDKSRDSYRAYGRRVKR